MVGIERAQLQKLSRLSVFSRWEVAELPKLLMPGEEVLAVLSGFYTSGTAILCVTTRRILLVDKKIMRLSYEDMRFEAISDVSFSQQGFLSSARFYIAGRNIQFRSWYKKELRILVKFVQNRMFEAHRQYESGEYNYHTNIRTPSNMVSSFQSDSEEDYRPEVLSQMRRAPSEIPQHIISRVARWKRAARFVSELES